MTRQLENLVADWNEEKEIFKRASDKYMTACNALVKTNDALYKKAKEEGMTFDEALKVYEEIKKERYHNKRDDAKI
jgi:lipoate synthase